MPTLRNATSIREASDIVLHEFENPQHQEPEVERERARLSTIIYNEQSGGEPWPVPPIPVPPEPPTPIIAGWVYGAVSDLIRRKVIYNH
jgi:hypothetical protein